MTNRPCECFIPMTSHPRQDRGTAAFPCHDDLSPALTPLLLHFRFQPSIPCSNLLLGGVDKNQLALIQLNLTNPEIICKTRTNQIQSYSYPTTVYLIRKTR
jgi:hypothetical protein